MGGIDNEVPQLPQTEFLQPFWQKLHLCFFLELIFSISSTVYELIFICFYLALIFSKIIRTICD